VSDRKTSVLLVEDEPEMARALAMNLAARGYHVSTAADGAEALNQAAAARPDVMVLDLGLPDVDGMEIIKAVRAYSSTPIVVLSGRTGSADKVGALEAGADDYMTKPFDVNELVARLRAATRRASTLDSPSTVTVGETAIDLVARTAERRGPDGQVERVALTPNEWRLLGLLLARPGRLVPQADLLAALRGQEGLTNGSYLRIYVAQLRRKLEPEPGMPRHLVTEPGMGYRFQP
jgi:two-component system KDP operon response regulator KdpE